MAEQKLTGYPSIDKPWLKYYSEEALAMKTPECTVYRNIYDNNKDYPKDIAIRYYGKDISYGTLFEKIEICAKSLKQIGIKEGDCVTLCSAGVPEAIYLVLACSKIGAIANFINPLFTTEQMVDRINDTESEWIFILDEMYSYIEKALLKTCIKNAVIIPVYHSMKNPIKTVASLKGKTKNILKSQMPYLLMHWNDFERIGTSYKDEIEAPYQKDTPVIMVYSSGSTGASKGIVLSNDASNATITDSLSSGLIFKRGAMFLQMIPVWFSTGIIQSVLLPLTNGVTVILEPTFNAETFVKDVIKYKPFFVLVATSIWLKAIHIKSFNSTLSFLEFPFTGGEKVIPQSEMEINAFLKDKGCLSPLMKGYGMCELGGKVTDSIVANKSGSVGIPMAHINVGVFDPTTNAELPYGCHGEIRVDSPSHMLEYYKNRAATKDYFWNDKNGVVWGCTGDIGYIDEDGLLFVLGRATDCATLDSGKKVYLFDIEDIILQEEVLSGCKVVAVEENGKTLLVAHMTVRKDVDYDCETLARKIYQSCKKNLPVDEVPTKYKFRDSFPVHANGKRDNNTLKQETDGFIVIQ